MGLKIEATEARSAIDIEAGIYQATVQKVEPADGTFGEQVKFTFGVDGQTTEDGEPGALGLVLPETQPEVQALAVDEGPLRPGARQGCGL